MIPVATTPEAPLRTAIPPMALPLIAERPDITFGPLRTAAVPKVPTSSTPTAGVRAVVVASAAPAVQFSIWELDGWSVTHHDAKCSQLFVKKS